MPISPAGVRELPPIEPSLCRRFSPAWSSSQTSRLTTLSPSGGRLAPAFATSWTFTGCWMRVPRTASRVITEAGNSHLAWAVRSASRAFAIERWTSDFIHYDCPPPDLGEPRDCCIHGCDTRDARFNPSGAVDPRTRTGVLPCRPQLELPEELPERRQAVQRL